MSLYPKVPIANNKHTETFNTNIDRLLNTKGVKPEDLAKHRSRFSGDAKKNYRRECLKMLMIINYNYIAILDKQYPNKHSIRDRIEFTMTLKMVNDIIFARMSRDGDYYDDDEVVDKLTMEKCKEKLEKLKKDKQWMDKNELNEYFKWHKRNIDPTTITYGRDWFPENANDDDS